MLISQEHLAVTRSPGAVLDASVVRVACGLLDARSLDEVGRAAVMGARALTGAPGAAFVVREGHNLLHLAEDSDAPMWPGRAFPADHSAAGWCLAHDACLLIPDVTSDPRSGGERFRAGFARSLVMVPVRSGGVPVAVLGAYWGPGHGPSGAHVEALQSVALMAGKALESVDAQRAIQTELHRRDRALAVIAHDLRNMLTPVMLQVDTLLRRGTADAELWPTWLGKMQKRLRHTQEFVRALTDLAAFAVGGTRFPVAQMDLAPLLRSVVGSYEELAAASGSNLVLHAPEQVLGRWNNVRLEQLATNLISNAIKYGAGRPVEIALTTDELGITLRVRDQGHGIPTHLLGRLFKAFDRLTDDASIPGLGLGLWISAQIAQAHGGTISVDSLPGAGTTFTVRLPRETPGR